MKHVRLLCVLAAVLISGCSTLGSSNVKPTDAIRAQSEIEESQLLDVGVELFDAGTVTEPQADKGGQSEDIRKAESIYQATHLKRTLQSTGNWGAVWVVPDETDSVDVLVSGTIVSSSGEHLVLEITAWDATGRQWLDKSYSLVADEAFYAAVEPGEDPYQDLYNSIANDLLAVRRILQAEQIREIRRVSQLRFAADLVPNPYESYLEKDSDGTFEVVRLPAEGDPMMGRMLDVREREYLLFDGVNDHYAYLYDEMEPAYENWRKFQYAEASNLRRIERDAWIRRAVGVAAILGGVAVGVSSGDQNAGAMRDLLVLGGAAAFVSGSNLAKEADIHAEAVRELGTSFEEEIAPQVVEVEGQTLKLTGTASEQYAKWREILRQIYYAETGFEPGQEVQPYDPVATGS